MTYFEFAKRFPDENSAIDFIVALFSSGNLFANSKYVISFAFDNVKVWIYFELYKTKVDNPKYK